MLLGCLVQYGLKINAGVKRIWKIEVRRGCVSRVAGRAWGPTIICEATDANGLYRIESICYKRMSEGRCIHIPKGPAESNIFGSNKTSEGRFRNDIINQLVDGN